MPKQSPSSGKCVKPIAAQCEMDHRRFAIDISQITPDGCEAVAQAGWVAEDDFIALTIADRVAIKGKLAWCKGRKANIRFFGQLHPHVVRELASAAA